ncbi:TetR/AcrR family transcriptional regulator C-terminal domain-containing protein [Paenibacillus eucommiae]|uniref:AcrR family transcriptional regulator n=1 Tax=Paenibacillus eucommiae TaxID=1355755 RepID=A0ABS4J0H0_9BACL|nr:TetR/AcrR family transcriptional regulator C-terminal domain-containing protein [Paenibacillus eucommiae]MBP1992249.1 AcrR family transcriptional regulator [Paenibacillus eucommiae]
MARRPKTDTEPHLDQKRIVLAALELLEEVGLKQLTMRKLAESLGVQVGALYWHVKDKEELLSLLADKISSDIIWHNGDISWREALVVWATNFRVVLCSYRDSVEIFNSSTISTGYNRLQQIEALFDVLGKAGFKDIEIPWMASMIKSYILGSVSEEVRLQKISQEREQTFEELGKNVNEIYQALPAAAFPHMARLAPYLTSPDWEQEFNFGLRVLLDGFTARLSQE